MAASAPQPALESQAQQNSPPTMMAAASPGVRPFQIYVLVVYYTALLILALALLTALIVKFDALKPLLRMMASVAGGALVGSVLYQIRMLFRYYIQDGKFDVKWLPKYFSAPWEAVALSVVVLSLIQGGGLVLGGDKVSLDNGNSFAAFGVGALVGFGIREVVGWLGHLVKTMFPNEPPQQ